MWLYKSVNSALNFDRLNIVLHYEPAGYIRYVLLAQATIGGIMATVSQPELVVVTFGIKEFNGRVQWLKTSGDTTESKT